MTDTFAVFVQADIPLDSAEMILVPLGMTEINLRISEVHQHCLNKLSLPLVTALLMGKFPSISISHSDKFEDIVS